MISRVRTVLLVSSLVLFVLCSLAAAEEDRWVLYGDRFSLSVPDTLSEAAAQALLEDRELALEHVESVLGCSTADTPIEVTVSFSLFRGTSGAAVLRDLIIFRLALREQDHFNTAVTIPHDALGCHEETHIVAALCWGHGAHAMREGLAVYMDRTYRGGAVYQEVALGLLARGALPSLQGMLQAQLSTQPSTTNSALIYQGGASFVAFVLDVHGLDALREFYWRSELPTVYLEDYAQRIFGRSLDELDADWREYLVQNAKTTPYAAARYLEAMELQNTRLGALQAQLGDLARSSEPAVLGRSEVCESVNTRLNALAEEILFAGSDPEADAAVERHQAALEDGEFLLTEWLASAAAFREALDSEDPEASLQLLDRAEAGYLAVEDQAMIEAVQATREGLPETTQL